MFVAVADLIERCGRSPRRAGRASASSGAGDRRQGDRQLQSRRIAADPLAGGTHARERSGDLGLGTEADVELGREARGELGRATRAAAADDDRHALLHGLRQRRAHRSACSARRRSRTSRRPVSTTARSRSPAAPRAGRTAWPGTGCRTPGARASNQPVPSPSSTRPPDISSTWATWIASIAGTRMRDRGDQRAEPDARSSRARARRGSSTRRWVRAAGRLRPSRM